MVDELKAEQITGSKWRLLAIPFGGPFAGKDLDGEYFSPKTDIKPHWFKARPVIFQHGMDATAKDEDYGEQELDAAPEKDGWWSTVWLNRSARYWAQVDQLLRAGKAFGSSGAISHLVRKAQDGEILVWPHAEQTITPTPINFFSRITAAKALDAFDSAGIAIDDPMKSIIADLDRLAADLPADLPEPGDLTASPVSDLGDGGNEAAMARLVDQVARLEQIVRSLRTR